MLWDTLGILSVMLCLAIMYNLKQNDRFTMQNICFEGRHDRFYIQVFQSDSLILVLLPVFSSRTGSQIALECLNRLGNPLSWMVSR